METHRLPIKELEFADYNPRHINDEVLERLKAGLTEYGLVQPIVVNENNNVIIGGHQRVKAAQALGWEEIDVVFIDVDEKNEKALNLALNKLSGEWDFSKLSEILTDFEADADFDLDLTGFDSLETMEMMDLGETLSLDDFDDIDMPGGSGETDEEESGRSYSIQYTIVFNDEIEQQRWHEYVRDLKEAFPDVDTIAERIMLDLDRRST